MTKSEKELVTSILGFIEIYETAIEIEGGALPDGVIEMKQAFHSVRTLLSLFSCVDNPQISSEAIIEAREAFKRGEYIDGEDLKRRILED